MTALNFVMLCVAVTLAVITIVGLAPLFWDAAGYIESIINATYRIDITVKGA